jgi:hypothetical protein
MAEAPYEWELGQTYQLALEVSGSHLRASVDGREVVSATDTTRTLDGGGVALVCAEGRAAFEEVSVGPVKEGK